MNKEIVYMGYVLKEENGHVDIYKNNKHMSTIKTSLENGSTAAKSMIDKVNGYNLIKSR